MLYRLRFLFILFILFASSCNVLERPDIIFEDFEVGTFKNWQVLGTTFLNPIQKDSIGLEVKNVQGNFLAISNNENPDDMMSQGKLVSKEFVIDRNFINFWVGGGDHKLREAVNLIIDNKVVMFATGNNDNVLRSVSWKVNSYIGKKAVIEIVDALSTEENENALPYIIVDHIVFSDRTNSAKVIFEDFESGSYEDWKIEGSAFEKPRNRINVYYPISVSGFGGHFFAFSFGENHDIKKGKLTSRDFVIEHEFIKFLIAGGDHHGKTCMNLIINDSIIFSQTGSRDATMRNQVWDVRNYKGKQAKLEIVDDFSEEWGHIMVDDIIFYDDEDSEAIIILSIALISFLSILGYFLYHKKNSKKLSTYKSSLSVEELKEIENIKNIIISNFIYRNPNPNLGNIANLADVHGDKLNYLFENSQYGSISNYINILRVEEFKRELKNPSNEAYTLLAIAYKCGFSSKSSFYRIFKSITNITPSDYKNSIE